MERIRYIAVEGPIGVGKTTLVDILAKELSGKTLLEEVEENPFLPKFYENRKKFAFQTQLFFLISRYNQQSQMSQGELFNSTIVSDYIFSKDKIFAYLNLDDNELTLYEQIYRLFDARIVKPDLVIYLQASPETLLERVRIRNKDYEKLIEENYLEDLLDAYNKFFFYYNETPLLTIDTTKIDFVESPEDLDNLIKEVKSFKGGTQHYIPLGSKG